MDAQPIDVSVIVPFFSAREHLPVLIEALRKQTFPSERFEVLLVDNGSNDDSAALLRQLLADVSFSATVLHYDTARSSYGARNLGARRARGQWLLFTDADCRPASGWIAAAVAALAPHAGCVISGRVELELVDRSNIWENFDKLAHMRNEVRAAQNEVATANMGVSRIDFERVGPFDVTQSGADFAWSRRAARQGCSVRYCAEVMVAHPTRKTRREIEAKLLRLSYGLGQLYRKRRQSLLWGVGLHCASCLYFPTYISYGAQMAGNVGLRRVPLFWASIFWIRARKTASFVRGYRAMPTIDSP